jgi:hypothetical protein
MLQLLSLAVPGVVLLDWSKTGGFITTAQRPSKQEDGQPAKNIKVGSSSNERSNVGRSRQAAAPHYTGGHAACFDGMKRGSSSSKALTQAGVNAA